MLDLGCAPGAWLQVACQTLSDAKHGSHTACGSQLVYGIDLQVRLAVLVTAHGSDSADHCAQEVQRPPRHCDERVRTAQTDITTLTAPALLQMLQASWPCLQ